MTDSTEYWFFSCSPKRWQIDLFLKSNREYGTYTVAEYHKNKIKPGQLAVIRVGGDARSKELLDGREKLEPGVYAIVEILDNPEMLIADTPEFYVDKKDAEQEGLRVKIRYLKNLITAPLKIADIKNNPIINQDTNLINGFRSATTRLNKDAFNEIINILGAEDQIFSNLENESADTNQEIARLELKYQYASPQVKEIISRRIERGTVSSAIKKLNNYKCQVCEVLEQNPYSFKKSNGEYYIETHHIVPVSNLVRGSLAISNLITVCANHHRQFHFGDILDTDTKAYLTIKNDGQVYKIEKNRYQKSI